MSTQPTQFSRVRFAGFELDCGTGELFKDGTRIKLQDQPTRLLILLVSRAGALVTRDEIQVALWEDGQFVEFEHAINVAIKKIREALGDDPAKPQLLETMPRRGYRFIAPVEAIESPAVPAFVETSAATPAAEAPGKLLSEQAARAVPTIRTEPSLPPRIVDEATLEREFALPAVPARILFLAVQMLYLTLYSFTLIKMEAVSNVLHDTGIGWLTVPLLMGAAGSIPVRLYLIFAVGLGHPAAGLKYRRMLPYLMPWDWLWAPSPFLAVHAIGPEWALVCTAVLVYPPITQLILMRSIDHPRNRAGQTSLD